MAVNRERVRLLVDALESGEYEQGQNRLQQNGKFCCLGVACEVAIANGVEINVQQRRPDLDQDLETVYDNATMFLPESVSDWYGFEDTWDEYEEMVGASNNPAVLIDGRLTYATKANDMLEATLPEIAEGFRAMYLANEAA